MSSSRIAGAPISWGVCEVPGWGYQMTARRVLDEMRLLGLPATEAGPDGFLPEEPLALREELGRVGLQLVGGFTPIVLHEPNAWQHQLHGVCRRFSEAGADVVVLAAATGRDDYDTRPMLSAADWRRLLSELDDAAALVGEHGLRAVLHPHVGTVIEKPDEIQRVIDGTSIGICLDTGHVMAGGGDPVALACQAPERIGHVHFKDVRQQLAADVSNGRVPYSTAVRNGLYCPLGSGDVDVSAIVGALATAGYDGWYVLEQDLMLDAEPADHAGPLLLVEKSMRYLRGLLGDTT